MPFGLAVYKVRYTDVGELLQKFQGAGVGSGEWGVGERGRGKGFH
jgi:hydrogenase maturation factor HypE